VGDDQRDPIDFIIHKLTFLDEFVSAQTVSVIRSVDHDRIVRLSRFFQCSQDPADLVIDQGTVAVVSGRDLLESFPAQIT
jgi:hypothetical protein